MSRELVDEGYVLHARPFRESSLLVEVVTSNHGRLGMVARGARRGKATLAGRLQVFRRLYLRWSPRGDLHTLYAAEELQRHPLPTERMTAGLYLNELLMRLLTRHDPCQSIFDAYSRTLEGIPRNEMLEPLLRNFELDLLNALGYGLDFSREADLETALTSTGHYRFVVERGFLPVVGGSDRSLSGADLLAMARRDWSRQETLTTAKRVLRMAIETRLGDKPLQTRTLLSGLARLRRLTQIQGKQISESE